MKIVYLALGSNLGDRVAFMAQAEGLLNEHPNINILKASKLYETEPWPKKSSENEGQWFLNQVLKAEISLSPQELLKVVKGMEQKIGRVKKEHWGEREIDIDILLYGNEIIDSAHLHIPHPHMTERQFVLVPLVEIAPELTDPMTGRRFSDMLEELQKEDRYKVSVFL